MNIVLNKDLSWIDEHFVKYRLDLLQELPEGGVVGVDPYLMSLGKHPTVQYNVNL